MEYIAPLFMSLLLLLLALSFVYFGKSTNKPLTQGVGLGMLFVLFISLFEFLWLYRAIIRTYGPISVDDLKQGSIYRVAGWTEVDGIKYRFLNESKAVFDAPTGKVSVRPFGNLLTVGSWDTNAFPINVQYVVRPRGSNSFQQYKISTD